MFLLLNLVEVGEDYSFDIALVLGLVELHYGELLGEAGLDIVVDIDEVLGGEFGILDHANEVVGICQFLAELLFNGLGYYGDGSISELPFLALGDESIVVGFDDLHCSPEGLVVVLCEFDAVAEVVEDLIEELSLEVVHLHELLTHYCCFPLPGGVLQKGVP